MRFPDHFLWGAATSAYQVEGGNAAADWWDWEQATGRESSGAACRHYDLYPQDFDLAKELGHNAHRFSVEWSRIEPEEGVFSPEALKHYIDVVLFLKSRGIEPIVTLHHFTNPLWLARLGGWENKRTVKRFARYVDVVACALAPHVRYWVTINEPTVYAVYSYLFGIWPPQGKSLARVFRAQRTLAAAHILAYGRIRKIYDQLKLEQPRIGISQFTHAFVPCTSGVRDRLAAWAREKWVNLGFLDEIARHGAVDFIGLNYYARQLVETRSWRPAHFFTDVCERGHHPLPKNTLGWDIYPEGLEAVLLSLKKYHRPVIVTENGVCTSDDDQRWQYIRDHLKSVHAAISRGVDVRGYLYWSLMDNFEWDKGFVPRFGLVDVDYATGRRQVRSSAKKFGEVCRTGVLE